MRGRKLRALLQKMAPSRQTWASLQILALAWNCFQVPFRLSFYESLEDGETAMDMLFLLGDVLADLLLIGDILLQKFLFRVRFDPRLSSIVMPEVALTHSTTHERKREERMTSHEQYRKKVYGIIYVATDVFCALPLDYIARYAFGKTSTALALRLVKFLRILRLDEQSGVLFLMLERKRVIVNAGLRRMILLWTVFFFFAHWFACGFFAVAYESLRRDLKEKNGEWDWDSSDSWASNDGLIHVDATGVVTLTPGTTILHAYVRSIYWAIITMVTVGLGDVVPAKSSGTETLFTLLTMYTGMTLTCLVIGNLTNMVANLDAAEDEFHTKMDNMNKYMSYRHLSTDLRDRIRAYYTYMWTSLKGVNEAKFLQELPITLRLQVAGLRSKDLVTQVHFLRKLRDPVINAICVALEQVIVSPGDFVAKAGQNMSGCYWLRRGEAEIISSTGAVLAQLSGKHGTFLGEMSLFFPGNFENSIRAKSYCEFFFLKKELFEDILSESLEEDEFEEIRSDAEKAAKRSAKVKKFFGLDNTSKETHSWKDILLPRSRFRELWNAINFVGVAYMSMIGPYRLATQTFMFAKDVRFDHFVFDWILDVLFIIDVIFRARLFGFVQEGVVIRDSERIFQEYKRAEPWLTDLVVLLPLDVVAAVDKTLLPILRINKLARINFLMRHYDIAQAYMAARRITISNGLHRIIKIFFGVIWCVHIVGCGWMIMSLFSRHQMGFDHDALEEFGTAPLDCSKTDYDWVCMDGQNWSNINHSQPGVTYLRAIYFVLVDMTTVGYGDLIPYNTRETAYVAFITFIGGLGYPAVVGAMAALISSLDTARTDFQRKLSILTQYMAVKRFPRPLRVRIMRYYDYLWSRQRGVDEDYILHDLPSSLRMEVQEYINGAIMRNITFLDGVDQELLRHLLSVLQPSVFLPGDYIITAGELGQDMYLLEKGATRVTSPNGKLTYAVLTPGDYFGEGSLLGLEKRTANVIAIGYCDCFVLNKDDFDRVTRDFPQQRGIVITRLRATLQEKRLRNASVIENMDRHSKLSVITSYEYDDRKTVSDASWRHPESGLRRAWDVFILLAILYNFAIVPVRLALNAGLTLFAVDYTLDVLLAIDVYCRYKLFGFLEGGQVFTDQDEIRSNYFNSGARRRDIITTLPFDVLSLVPYLIGVDNSSLALAMACCRIPKLLLVLRMPKLKANLDTLFGMSRFRDYIALYRLFLLIIAVIAISHWTGCFFYAIAYYERPDDEVFQACMDAVNSTTSTTDIIRYSADSCPEETFFTMGLNLSEVEPCTTCSDVMTCGATYEAHCRWNKTWIQNQMEMGLLPLDGGSLDHQYLRALNWALPTLVVVVIGDTIPVDVPGTLYVTFMIIIGVTINAAIIGSIANLMANLEGSAAKYREKMDTFERFLYMYKVPPALQQRTRNYLEYLWETEKDAVQASLVDHMPATLRAEVSNFLKLRFVIQTPFFEFCDTALSKGIAAKLVTEVFSPHDFILYEGDVGTEMYFIEQGTVQMVSFRGTWRSGHRASSVAFEPGTPAANQNAKMNLSGKTSNPERIKSTGSLGGPSGVGVVKQPSLSSLRSSVTSTKRASMVALDSKIGEDEIIVLATLEAGSYFGETAVFFNERRSCSARAMDFTELYSLSRDDLDEVLLRYPHQADRMFSVVSELRENNQLRNDNLRHNMEEIIAGSKMLNFMSEKRQSFTGGSILDYGRRMLTKRPSFLKSAAAGGGSGRPYEVRPASPKSPTSIRTSNFGSTLYKSLMTSSLKSSAVKVAPNKKYGIDGKPVPKLSHHLVSESRMKKKRLKAAARKARIYRPNETFCRVWNMASLFFTMYFAFSIPFRFAFFADSRPPFEDHKMPLGVWAWFVVEYGIDIFFLVDIYMRYKRFAINKYGKVITNESLIAENYRKTWLLWDLLASFPVDIFAWVAFASSAEDSHITLMSVVRFIHMLRLLRLHGYSKLLDKYVHELFPRINSSVMSVFFLFVGILMLNHWASCTWFIVHRYLEIDLHKTWAIADGLATYDPDSGQHNIFNDELTPWFVYLRALYFTVTTMSSVGYGDIRPYTLLETVHELIVVVLGACTFAALIGSVAVVFLHWDSRGEISFKSRLRKLIEFMEFRELPSGLQREIIDHFTNHWEHFEGVDMHSVIEGLPLPLQLELAMCIHHEIIDKVRGLRKCHIHVQRHIARKLQMQICGKGEYVFREGEIGHEIYFIKSGEVEVTAPEHSRAQSQKNLFSLAPPSNMSIRGKGRYTLRAGHHFGGECLYSLSGERTMTVQCSEDCELVFIAKDEFERIMVEFPEHRTIGIFAELVHPERKTIKQSKELHRQVAEIAGSVQTPLGRFSARHIANILGNPNTAFLRDRPAHPLSRQTLLQTHLNDDTILANPKSRKSFEGGHSFAALQEDADEENATARGSATSAETLQWVDPAFGQERSRAEKDRQRRLTRELSANSDRLSQLLREKSISERRVTVFRGTRKANVAATVQRGSLTFEDAQDFLAYTRQRSPSTANDSFAIANLPVLSPQSLERRQTEILQ